MSYLEKAEQIRSYMVDIRRRLHQIPELGLHLPKTMDCIAAELDKLGIAYQRKDDISCIFAQIGNEDQPCILLRADMDGLAIQEQSGEEFACTTGTMHACGHDMHAAALLGAAKLLKEEESGLQGTVKLLFQSAEETFEGALAAIEAGVLENPRPNVAYASHVFSMYPLNQFGYGQIPMGAVYGFKIILEGHGGHGSQPDLCIDPINAGVQVYLALQSLIARECPPTEEAVLTIGQFKAGEAANIIPNEAVLQGTLRTFKPEIKDLLVRRINEIVPAIANAYRCKAQIQVLSTCPSVVNSQEFSDFCMKTLQDGDIAKEFRNIHLMGSEDFAQIAAQIPSCYFVIGAMPEDKQHALGQHNPGIRFHEDAMVTATSAYAQIAWEWLKKEQTFEK